MSFVSRALVRSPALLSRQHVTANAGRSGGSVQNARHITHTKAQSRPLARSLARRARVRAHPLPSTVVPTTTHATRALVSLSLGSALLGVAVVSSPSSSPSSSAPSHTHIRATGLSGCVSAADGYYKSNTSTRFLYDYLTVVNEVYPNDADVLWRLARATHDIVVNRVLNEGEEGIEGGETLDKKEYLERAHILAKEAVDRDDENFAAHKWFAITLSALGDYRSSKQSINNAFVIRDHFMRAVDLNPNDATGHHLLGLWCIYFADLPWYMASIAGALFATPPTSTYGEALAHLLVAERVEPDFYIANKVAIGKVLVKMGDKESARRWLEGALAMTPGNDDDTRSQAEAEELLKGC